MNVVIHRSKWRWKPYVCKSHMRLGPERWERFVFIWLGISFVIFWGWRNY